MIIRDMIYEDIPQAVKLGKMMHAESSYNAMSFSDGKCINIAAIMINSADGFAMVADEQGEILGMMAGSITSHWFSDDLMASDYVLYVTQAARGTSAAVRLITAYKEWAISQGVKTVTLGISAEIDNEKTASICEHLGFRRSAILMRYDVND